jgi:hypothetical protein
MFGAAAVNANDVWAVGYYFDGTLWQSYTMQWTGAAWTAVASPNYNGPDTYYNRLSAAGRIPAANSVWAVGFHGGTAGLDVPDPTKDADPEIPLLAAPTGAPAQFVGSSVSDNRSK